nr:putative RNA-dependent RNA polymerase [Rhizoctonia solani mitovirus 128]
MKTKFSIFKKFGRLPLNLERGFNAMLSVKRRPQLMFLFLRIGRLARVQIRRSKVAGLYIMVSRCLYLYKTSGPKGLVLYLKTCGVLLQQTLGSHKLVDSGLVSKVRVSRNNRGLPRLIPAVFRRAIRNDEFKLIKLILTFINLYREIEFEGAPKLSTITDSNKGDMVIYPTLLEYIPIFFQALGVRPVTVEQWERALDRLPIIWKAAPAMLKERYEGIIDSISNYSTHPVQLVMSLRALKKSAVWSDFKAVIEFTQNRYLRVLVDLAERSGLLEGPYKAPIGKLHAKEEAAGKVRLFAIVEAWTQWAMYPIHRIIFRILRKIPQDGTFDQTAPITLLQEKVDSGAVQSLYSLDLTAATDRMPILVQINIMQDLVGNEMFGYQWANVLVGRPYGFYQLGYSKYHGTYHYAVGQPMGALSSWAMLALTHHFIVQVAAWQSNLVPIGSWYQNYALLGDDLVLGDASVKDAYLSILKSLGMEVNVHKSVISDTGTCMEFAKRTIYKGVDVSPIPLKEVASSMTLLPALVQFARKYGLSLTELLQGFGFGWRVLSWLSKPLGKQSGQIRAIILALAMPTTAEEIRKFFAVGSPKFTKYVNSQRNILMKFVQTELRVARLKLEQKLIFVKDFRYNFGSEELPKLWFKQLQQSQVTLLTEEVDNLQFDLLAGLANQSDENRLKTLLAKLTSDLKDLPSLPVKKDLAIEFFYEVFRYVINPGLATYMVTVQKTLQTFPKLWEDPFRFMWSDRGDLDFISQYALYLEFLGEISKLGEHIFKFQKPEGSEGISRSLSAVTPAQIRYFRKWSGILQGSVPINELKINVPKIKDVTLMSNKIDELQDDD